ncbi:LEAF RUST 10 DISEASE-RESISTANCE LOCUS RECEPTOR-LIKE PROTEIN KINASE-like 1.2 [Phragmites australis]|uniref:LEAF RUST 10 DISEASE-RESISTANCE LOCUS RECEPTOR-LIKE PROTEIN KINASE-like 1.2 n=1 Tax=Phragmites australis TaxID=29695 RepID=UPI002D7890A8|nr:LEAF RUST 10 DISEASE-RESISTANCE LOCUS RECEPTOR-LIKE PROTEIN KINASE-like 1.2 [Phragmites australis]
MAPLLLHLLRVLLLLAAADAFPATCSNTTCGDQTIAYPFWLNSSVASDCGYPGLGLACKNNTTLLPVQSHWYRVVAIDYTTHTIWVSDLDVGGGEYAPGCPRLHVNLSIDYTSSWLQLTPSDSNITFLYNCKKNVSWSSAVELSGCQDYDGKRSYVLPDGGITGAEAYEYECEEVVVAPVMAVHKDGMLGAPGAPPPTNGSFSGVVRAGFELMYNAHSQQCGRCERSGGWCGYRRNETHGRLGFTCFCDGGPTSDRCGHSQFNLI